MIVKMVSNAVNAKLIDPPKELGLLVSDVQVTRWRVRAHDEAPRVGWPLVLLIQDKQLPSGLCYVVRQALKRGRLPRSACDSSFA